MIESKIEFGKFGFSIKQQERRWARQKSRCGWCFISIYGGEIVAVRRLLLYHVSFSNKGQCPPCSPRREPSSSRGPCTCEWCLRQCLLPASTASVTCYHHHHYLAGPTGIIPQQSLDSRLETLLEPGDLKMAWLLLHALHAVLKLE